MEAYLRLHRTCLVEIGLESRIDGNDAKAVTDIDRVSGGELLAGRIRQGIGKLGLTASDCFWSHAEPPFIAVYKLFYYIDWHEILEKL
jgi:hypothetical protein